jgi:hypothetical protein
MVVCQPGNIRMWQSQKIQLYVPKVQAVYLNQLIQVITFHDVASVLYYLPNQMKQTISQFSDFAFALSRKVAKSGIKPEYQNNK